MARTPQTFSIIQSLRDRYYRALPGKEALIRVITEAEIPEHVYNSNAIENSTLTLEETEKILLQIDSTPIYPAQNIHFVAYLAPLATITD